MASLAPSEKITTPCRLAISSNSLGSCYAGHTLEHRLEMADRFGYEGIELFHDDLVFMAMSLPGPNGQRSSSKTDGLNLLRAASCIADMCAQHRLRVVCLQPFRHYEGLRDRGATKFRLGQLKEWCHAANILSTDLILIPSNFLSYERLVGDDVDTMVKDLQEAADLAATFSPRIRLCYEALAWGTYVDTWEKSWDIVKKVDRVNLGLCLDTFNIAARVYADPAEKTGLALNGHQVLVGSMQLMKMCVDVKKLFLLQVADAEKLDAPLLPGHPFYDPELPARMSWSRNCRLFYDEPNHGGFLPIEPILKTIFWELGYRGWVSFELFNRHLSDADPELPEKMAKRGVMSWEKMRHTMQLPIGSPAVTGDKESQDHHPGCNGVLA